MGMPRYQFQLDNRPAGPIRPTWKDAARDAVNDGYAVWTQGGHKAKFDDTQGATVVMLPSADDQRIQELEAEVKRLRDLLTEAEPHLRRLSHRDGDPDACPNIPSRAIADRIRTTLQDDKT